MDQLQNDLHICDYGCGEISINQFKNGKWCCSNSPNKCSAKKVRILDKSPRKKPEFCDYGCGEKPNFYFKGNRKWCCSKSQNGCPTIKNKLRNAKIGKVTEFYYAQPIDTDEICNFGCNQIANYRYKGKNGSYCCVPDWHACPGQSENISNRSKKIWEDEEKRKKLGEGHKLLDLVAKAIPVLDDDKVCPDCGRRAYFWFRTNDRYCCENRIERCPVVRNQILDRFKDPDYLNKYKESMNAKPNKPEIFLIKLFDDLKLQYEYVGDYSKWIDGKNPDFINEDKKKIIEHFGEYWHGNKVTGESNDKHEINKILHFEKNGYDCLIIWEDELKDIPKLIDKILEFNKKPNLFKDHKTPLVI